MIFKDNLTKSYYDADFDKPKYIDDVFDIYTETRRENEKRNDTPAHTMHPGYPHIENTTFNALKIFEAMKKSGFVLNETDWINLGIAGLRHDTGYWKNLRDTEGTGAKLTAQHVKRSMAMTDKYLKRKEFPQDRIDLIKEAIGYTEVFGPKPEITSLGGMLAGGDALGLISDPDYVDTYLPLLWEEFKDFEDKEGKTMNEKLGYETIKDIQGPNSAAFIRQILLPAVELYLPYLDRITGGEKVNLYRLHIQRNLDLLEGNIDLGL